MSTRKHKQKKCDSDQMVKEGCESKQAINEVIRKFCEDVERRNKPEEADTFTGVLAALEREPREA